MHYFSLFFKKIQFLIFNFCAFGRKTQLVVKILKIFGENSIEKLNFYLFLRKVVAKNRAIGNNIIFLQQFYLVRRGWVQGRSQGGKGGNSPPKPKKLQKNGVISESSIFSNKFSIKNKKFKFSKEFLSKNFKIFSKFPNNLRLSSKRAKNEHIVC